MELSESMKKVISILISRELRRLKEDIQLLSTTRPFCEAYLEELVELQEQIKLLKEQLEKDE